jgi:type I restriction enzyme R subunit
MTYSEGSLVQQTTADYLSGQLGWESVFAYNEETFGPAGTLGRLDDREIILSRYLRLALAKFNPGLPQTAYDDAIRTLTDYSISQSTLQINKEKHDLLREGVPVQFRNEKGTLEKLRLRVFDFNDPENNYFLAVRELWVRGLLYRRRPDLMGFVNGIPLLFMEFKNIPKDLRIGYEKNLSDYKDTVPHLFHHNAVIILGNGVEAKLGSLTSQYEHFHEWKRLAEEEPGVVDMETLLKGICTKNHLIDLFENFVLFDDSSGHLVKIVARNHQVLGVNRAVEAVRDRKARQGKLGVFWHTQGSGKSYSMVCFTRKVRRKLGGHFTFLVCTDRDDLDTQIYRTFAGCELVNNDKDRCRASSGEDLLALLNQHKAFVFTLIQKFSKDVDPSQPYSNRDDIIVITDEAHRTQYGRLALNMRNALPCGSYIGFTGTPLFSDDEITRRMFGDYISTYDFQRAVQDKATVPLYYDARGERLGVATNDVNERIAEKLEELEIEDLNVTQRLERELKRDYHVITAPERLEQIAKDFVEHYSTSWESGKAMFICIDKITCGRMYKLIQEYWQGQILVLEKRRHTVADEQELVYRDRQINWMRDTRMAVVVSEEQGEVEKFQKWELDIKPHRQLMKEGFETSDGKRLDVETAFKKAEHPFRVVFVCAMWLTGFDVPSLVNLYLDKPLKAHTLMQAIARANRIHEGKNNGLIIDYCGILKNLRKALATFAGHKGAALVDPTKPQPEINPVRPDEELLADLAETVALVRGFLEERGVYLEHILERTSFERNRAIVDAKEAINENDESRKRFEVFAREMFKKFKACLTLKDVNAYRGQYDAINIIYRSLQNDRDNADISYIIQDLHSVISDSVKVEWGKAPKGESKLYDMSQIDFDRLRIEYENHHGGLKTAVQNIKEAAERRLAQMMKKNPLRTNFQKHYEEIVEAYNREKDRVTIEQTFEELLRFVESLDQESHRAIREGLDEDALALFDLLVKPDMAKSEIERIKKIANGLLTRLKTEKLKIDNWRAKQATRDAIRTEILDFLYDERTGLSTACYTEDEVKQRAEQVYLHVYRLVQDYQPKPYI